MILKNDFKTYIIVIGCLFVLSYGYAQDLKKVSFPQAYFGVYKGNLKITNPKGTQTIPMEFHLKATDSIGKYVYTLVYGEGEQRKNVYTI